MAETWVVLSCLGGWGAGAQAATSLTEADAGAVRVVAVGETIELSLKENPSTGYVWAVAIDPPAAASVISDHWRAKSDLVGAPGTRDWTIKIILPGVIAIRAKNWRSWEGDASVTRRIEFRLDAR